MPSAKCLLLALLTAASCTLSARARGFIDRLEPPVAERGKTTRVTLVGSQLANARDLWTSLPAGAVSATAITSEPGRATFDLRVSATAPVGMAGLRLATTDGLSNVQLFLIDDLPVRPRPTLGDTPTKVTLPVALWGAFREGEVDRFALDATAGQRVSFEAVANRFGRDSDPLITIRDAAGRWIAEHDYDAGLYFDCRFEHVFAAAGAYVVEVRDARYHGGEHAAYVLRMGRFPAARTAVPAVVQPGATTDLRLPELGQTTVALATAPTQADGAFFAAVRRPGDEGSAWLPLEASSLSVTIHRETNNPHGAARLPMTAAGMGGLAGCIPAGNTLFAVGGLVTSRAPGTDAAMPGMLCGVLAKPNQRDLFWLRLKAGQRLIVRAEARSLNSPADLEMQILDGAERELRRASDTNGLDEPLRFDFAAPADGPYGLAVRDAARDGGPAFAYRIEVRPALPRLSVTAEVEGVTVPRASYQPIPITIVRADYAGPVLLTLLDAPPGVTLTPTLIPAGVNAVVCKLHAAPAAPLGVATFRIVAQPMSAWETIALKTATGRALPSAALPPTPTETVRTQPLIGRQLLNVDLIPYTLREDQRRLPPALTDRFALLVAPPAPFDFELVEPEIALARYQQALIPVRTTRAAGFAGPIAFTARGGQLADKQEGRTRVYAEFPPATAGQPAVNGVVVSRILANVAKTRIEVEASGLHEGRRVALMRTFDLDLRTAFEVTAEPPLLALLPGAAGRVRIVAKRVKTFDGAVKVELAPLAGFGLPPAVVIPAGRDTVDVEVKVPADAPPGRHGVGLHATATVSGFEEEHRGGRFEIDVRKPETPKK